MSGIYSGPERRHGGGGGGSEGGEVKLPCETCSVHEQVVESAVVTENNFLWIKIIGSAILGMLGMALVTLWGSVIPYISSVNSRLQSLEIASEQTKIRVGLLEKVDDESKLDRKELHTVLEDLRRRKLP